MRIAFPGENQLRQSHATQPTVHAGWFNVSIIHRTLTWTAGSVTCARMLMHAIAHGGVRTPSESAVKVDWEKNPSPHQGFEPASAEYRSDALPTKLHPLPLPFFNRLVIFYVREQMHSGPTCFCFVLKSSPEGLDLQSGCTVTLENNVQPGPNPEPMHAVRKNKPMGVRLGTSQRPPPLPTHTLL